jgi:hypothetical protein
MFSEKANRIFNQVIETYHVKDEVHQEFTNPFDKTESLIEHLLYRKCWIDTVQWHYEDLIRDPNISPEKALVLKRKIDASNQDRTDTVEYVDSYFLDLFDNIQPNSDAKINTESPAWGIDRLSILALKIYHMNGETNRTDASIKHQIACKSKLDVLVEQRKNLSLAIDQLLEDIKAGDKYMKVYKQMKMYNDDEMNPVLRSKH